MTVTLNHKVKTADIVIISRTGESVGYTVPVDLVLFLLWFLSSATAQFLAILTMMGVNRLYQGWKWLTDWPAWWAGVETLVDDFRNLGRALCLSVS